MLTYPNIDKTIVSLGPLEIRWYSMMYVIGMVTVYYFFRHSSKKGSLKFDFEQIESVMVHGLIGMILGARLTYVFVYNFSYYLNHPSEIFSVWKGGLSFHGALIGICLALVFYCKKNKKSFFNLMDHMALVAPVGLGFGRIGNFINGELWGRQTTPDFPLGMVFPTGGPLPRHPSQLYEAFAEGLCLLIILFLIRKIWNPATGVISGAFLVGYGVMRFIVEFFREPDVQLGFILGPFSMGQLLCSLMCVAGLIIIIQSQKAGSKA